jgi:predicted ester cyclase
MWFTMLGNTGQNCEEKEGRCQTMSTEENKARVRRLIEEFINKRDLAVADEIFATNFVNHSPAVGTTPDRQGIKQYIAMLHSAFPDFHCAIEDLIAEGDRVVVRLMCRGTHRGDLMGVSPTGRQVDVTAISILHFAGGKVMERWNSTDNLGMMQQLGVVSLPGQTGG